MNIFDFWSYNLLNAYDGKIFYFYSYFCSLNHSDYPFFFSQMACVEFESLIINNIIDPDYECFN